VVLTNVALQSPLLGQLAVPFAAYPVAFGVVILLRVAEFLAMISAGLACTERLGNGKHVRLLKKTSRRGLHGVFLLAIVARL